MGLNAIRVAIQEGRSTFTQYDLARFIDEVDMRLNGANCFLKIVRANGYIETAQFYSDPEKTNLVHEMFFDRVSGSDGILRVTGVSSVYYNDDMSVDSVVSGGMDRASGEPFEIECCSGFFWTEEDTKI